MCFPEIVQDQNGGNQLTHPGTNDMSPVDNKTLIAKFWQIFNEAKVDDNGELDKAAELENIIDSGCVLRHAVTDSGQELHGHDSIKAWVSTIRTALDFKVIIDEELFHQWTAEGDRVVTIWQGSGKPESKEVQVFPPLDVLWDLDEKTDTLEFTDPIKVYGVTISHISDGKIAEIWMNTHTELDIPRKVRKGFGWFFKGGKG